MQSKHSNYTTKPHNRINRPSCVLMMLFAMSAFGLAEQKSSPSSEVIKSYCIDFNWDHGRKAGFAKPGMWAEADPKAHVDWYQAVGANVIQTFAVSCNGYAWYKSDLIPEQPGMKHDFLTELVKLGHAKGMKVMGYFCIAANTRWGKENPELSYGTPSGYHIPYTDPYLAYLSSAITDAIKTTGIDGFMIDWVWMPDRKANEGKWLEIEKKLYQQLMGEPFPGEENLTKEKNLAYGQKAIDRCWSTIHKAAKNADPDCIIWLTTNHVNNPLVKDSKMYKEVDWLMGETGKLSEILKLKPMVGKQTRLITCFSDFGGGDPTKDVPAAIEVGVGLYGYAKPDRDCKDGIIDLDDIFGRQYTELHGNSKRIAVLARAYRGNPVNTVWKDGTFVAPDQPAPFQLEIRQRSSRHSHDSGRVDFEEDKAVISINTPYHKGRAVLTRDEQPWPASITVRLKRQKADKPYATDFRVANGKVGVGVSLKDKVEVIAGKMEGMGKGAFWRKEFLNNGNPESPVEPGTVKTSVTDDAVEVTIPSIIIIEGNPPIIAFEWGIDGQVF